MTNASPVCRHCQYWQRDYGTWTATGWTGMGREVGDCNVEPGATYRKNGDQTCRYFLRRGTMQR